MPLKYYLALPLIITLIAGCTYRPASPTPMDTPIPPTVTPTSPTPAFRIVGYVTDWDMVDQIQYDKLTHINYAFLLPLADGVVSDVVNPWKLEEVVSKSHVNGVQVLISVGGWGYDAEFEQLTASAESRARFVSGMAEYVEQYQLDGVDIDWEYPDTSESGQNFLALMRELRAALPEGKLLTAAVVAVGENGDSIPAETFAVVDFLNLMAYDGAPDDHSPYEYAVAALDYWAGRGLEAEKTVLGVPFYSRPGELQYRKIVQTDAAAAFTDIFLVSGHPQYYNGIPTIQRKTELAMQRASGIMIWELGQDAAGDASLLNAIYQTASGHPLAIPSTPTPVK